MVNNFFAHLRRIAYLAFPGKCLLCQRFTYANADICGPCRAALPWLEAGGCPVCALPLTIDPNRGSYCGDCLHHQPAFDHCFPAFGYQWPINILVQQFKHRGQMAAGSLLGQLWLERMPAAMDQPDVLLPVPLHWRRQMVRGFNQSLLIAEQLGKARQLPVSTILKRSSATASQQGLSAEARHKNLRKAFGLSKPLQHRHVALIDDVMTTGSTAHHLALLCKTAGAERVDVWCLARTL